MLFHILPQLTNGFAAATHYGETTYADLTASGNTQTLNLAPIAAKMGAALTYVQLVDAFVSSDGTLVSTAITVGDSGSANRYLTSMELNNAGTVVWLKGGVALNPIYNVYTAGDNLQVAFTATAAKALNSHTAGKVRFYFQLVDARGGAFPLVA